MAEQLQLNHRQTRGEQVCQHRAALKRKPNRAPEVSPSPSHNSHSRESSKRQHGTRRPQRHNSAEHRRLRPPRPTQSIPPLPGIKSRLHAHGVGGAAAGRLAHTHTAADAGRFRVVTDDTRESKHHRVPLPQRRHRPDSSLNVNVSARTLAPLCKAKPDTVTSLGLFPLLTYLGREYPQFPAQLSLPSLLLPPPHSTQSSRI